jgi:hypothetical protein
MIDRCLFNILKESFKEKDYLSVMRIINLERTVEFLGPIISTYKDICVMSVEPDPGEDLIKMLADKYDMDRLENLRHEVLLIAGFPTRTHECYSNCIEFLKELKSLRPDTIFVSGLYRGKLHQNVIQETLENKLLVDEIFDNL